MQDERGKQTEPEKERVEQTDNESTHFSKAQIFTEGKQTEPEKGRVEQTDNEHSFSKSPDF